MSQLSTLLQAAEAPEMRLPSRDAGRVNHSFYTILACLMLIGVTPLLIGWAAAELLR